jgi:hypothetical protein
MKDHYKKYLKYKDKYLRLKQQIGGNNNYELKLKELYPECVHDNAKNGIKNAEKYLKDGYSTTYGEMDYLAIEELNKKLNPEGKIKYFIDLGSGRGKLPLIMANKVDKKSIGIELVTERHESGLKLLNTLSIDYPQITNKVELICGDMFTYLDSINKMTFESPVLIWISNLCFGEEITSRLFKKLIEKMPSNSIIGSSKVPDNVPPGIKPFILEGNTNTLLVPMSWSNNSTIYIYMII